ncbi:MIP18 family protein FAM96A [Amphibalanus amphitrite]|uniref:MIP18 family protein FAM96A n=1 Tax=Amphibalanus amphitrite TaxID=1232801 RepID=A0A6A4VIP9_AMPAM|nr:MIP18 family protein FAM96A [Amphibalanus amphitrite]
MCHVTISCYRVFYVFPMSLVEVAREADSDCQDKAEQVYDLIRCIEDPEKASSLEDLGVVSEEDVSVSRFPGVDGAYYVRVQLTPTVPQCSLATLIGLCVRVRLQENLDFEHKLDIVLKEGSHHTSDEGKWRARGPPPSPAACSRCWFRLLLCKCMGD